MSEQNNDIDALVPTPKRVKIGDREITVGPLNMGQLLAVRKVFSGGKLEKLASNADMLDLIDTLMDEMIEVVRIACDLDEASLHKLTGEEFIELCTAIIEGNRDFFVRWIGPALHRLMGELIRVAAMVQPATGSTGSRP